MTTSSPLPPERLRPPARDSGAGVQGPRRPPTAVMAGAAVVALTGLVAIASHGTPVWTSLREGRANRSEILANIGVVGGVGIVAALVVTLIIHRTLIANRAGAPPVWTTLRRALPMIAVALAVLALLTITRTGLQPAATDSGNLLYGPCAPGEPCAGSSVPEVPAPDGGGEGIASPGIDAQTAPESPENGQPDPQDGRGGPDPGALRRILLLVLGAVAAAIGAAALWLWYAKRSAHRERLRDGTDPPADPDQAAAGEEVDGMIDSMLADPDPKTAIIGAYARLLEGLAACDAARRDHEAPIEHLQRALNILPVGPRPLRQLTGLFEIARFSTHRLTESHRDQALEALHAASADLAAAPSTPAGAGSHTTRVHP